MVYGALLISECASYPRFTRSVAHHREPIIASYGPCDAVSNETNEARERKCAAKETDSRKIFVSGFTSPQPARYSFCLPIITLAHCWSKGLEVD